MKSSHHRHPLLGLYIHLPLQTGLSLLSLLLAHFLSSTFITIPAAAITLTINILMILWMTLGYPRAIDVVMADVMVIVIWLLGFVVGLVRVVEVEEGWGVGMSHGWGLKRKTDEIAEEGKIKDDKGVIVVWAIGGVALLANIIFWISMGYYGFDSTSVVSFRRSHPHPHPDSTIASVSSGSPTPSPHIFKFILFSPLVFYRRLRRSESQNSIESPGPGTVNSKTSDGSSHDIRRFWLRLPNNIFHKKDRKDSVSINVEVDIEMNIMGNTKTTGRDEVASREAGSNKGKGKGKEKMALIPEVVEDTETCGIEIRRSSSTLVLV